MCLGDSRSRFFGGVVEEHDGCLYVPYVLYGDGAAAVIFAHLVLEAAAVGVYEYVREGVTLRPSCLRPLVITYPP